MDGALWTYILLALTTAPPLVPNAALIATAGALAAAGELSLIVVLLVVAGSAIAGDAAVYGIGRLASAPALRWLARTSRRRTALEWTATRIHAHGVPFVVAVRFLPSGRLVGGLVAAVVRYPARRYLLGAGIAEVVWASYSVAIGYWGGSALNNVWSALAVGTAVSLLVAVLAQLLARRSHQPTAGESHGRSRICARGGPLAPREDTGGAGSAGGAGDTGGTGGTAGMAQRVRWCAR
ncbi:DedA family protein [Streptomyces sp. 4N509B]|uniref:DedA family protein n=1 Tax=Streptomyces sp. 4N509B TaxID=3457413 RepID=UPI003FD4B7F9